MPGRFQPIIGARVESEIIYFNAGDHSISVSMRYADYVLVEKPELGIFAAELEP
jgi:hypothetical protein